MDHQQSLPIYVIALFPFAFVAMWCLILLILSVLGGWRRMAERFPARNEPVGRQFSMQRGKVGLVDYKGCLTIHTSPAGIYLAVWPPFRIWHPPVLIPWSEVRNAKVRKFLWTEGVKFEAGSPPAATVQLSKKVFEGYVAVE